MPAAEGGRESRDQVRLQKDVANGEEVRGGILQTATQAARGELLIDQAPRLGPKNHGGMGGFGVALQGHGSLGQRMMAAEHDGIVLFEQRFGGGSFLKGTCIGEEPDRQVNGAVAEVGFRHGKESVETAYLQADMRGLPRKGGSQSGQDAVFRIVRKSETEQPVARSRIEVGVRLERPAELGDAGPDRGAEAFGTGRGTDAASGPLKERVSEGHAEASEGVAHGGLAQPDAAGRAADIAFLIEGVEGEEEIEVERLDIHTVNIIVLDVRWNKR